jgi:putative spermidine/putrescine transport system permease protein
MHSKGGLWARVYVAVHLALVLLPMLVIALLAVAARWEWPLVLPREFTLRGVRQLLSGGLGMGWGTVGVSVGIGLASATIATVAGALAARAICCHEWPGRRLFEFATMLPFLIPGTVFAMGVQVAFIRVGLAGTVTGVTLAHAIVSLPYALSIMVEVTRAAGTGLEEASRTLGASAWQTLRYVTLPALGPGIASSLTMCYIISFSQYLLTLLIGGGSVRTYALVLFPYLTGGDRAVAGAFGLGFMVLTLAVFVVVEGLLAKVLRMDGPRGAAGFYAG